MTPSGLLGETPPPPTAYTWTAVSVKHKKTHETVYLYSRTTNGVLIATVEQDRRISGLFHTNIISGLGALRTSVVGDAGRAKAYVEAEVLTLTTRPATTSRAFDVFEGGGGKDKPN